MLDLSVVIISWRMKELLRQLLESLIRHTDGITYEIIVVDNGSRDGTSSMVRQEFPQVTLIENGENRGVAPARNQGFRIARGRYVVTLDADMVLKENSLKKMVNFMDETPSAGMCACKLFLPDGSVQLNARRSPTPLAILLRRLDFLPVVSNSKTLRNHEMAEWDRNDVRRVEYLIGACQLIRREAMEKTGLLDENIFYGPEDLDYCIRMRRCGWELYYLPITSMVHHEQRITKKKPMSKFAWIQLKGVIYLFWKYKGKLD